MSAHTSLFTLIALLFIIIHVEAVGKYSPPGIIIPLRHSHSTSMRCRANEDLCPTGDTRGNRRYFRYRVSMSFLMTCSVWIQMLNMQCFPDLGTNVDRCGSCDGPDCSALPHVDQVSCHIGKCQSELSSKLDFRGRDVLILYSQFMRDRLCFARQRLYQCLGGWAVSGRIVLYTLGCILIMDILQIPLALYG